MKTLALVNGDLVVGPSGHTTITGHAKIRQDMALALGEPLGNDRFHPDWGSVLPSYIGQPIDDETDMLVRAEVARVIDQYMSVQQREISRDGRAGTVSRFDTGDVISQVLAINAKVNYDSILVTVSLVTLSGTRVNIKRTVNI